MYHGSNYPLSVVSEHFNHVVMGIAAVNDEWFLCFYRQSELFLKSFFLKLLELFVCRAVIVQSDLTDGNYLGMRSKFLVFVITVLLRNVIVRMKSDGGPDAFMLFGEFDGFAGHLQVRADTNHANPGIKRTPKYFVAVFVVLRKLRMTMGIKNSWFHTAMLPDLPGANKQVCLAYLCRSCYSLRSTY